MSSSTRRVLAAGALAAALPLASVHAAEPAATAVEAPAASVAAPEELPVSAASPEARTAFSRGRALYYNLRNDEARAALADAIKSDPNCIQAYVYTALATRPVAAGKDSIDRAIKLKDKANEGEKLLLEAVAAQIAGDSATEEKKREALVAMFPKDWRVLAGRGNRLFHLGRYEDAITYLDRAVKAAPDEASPYNDLGYAYAYAGKLDDAVRTLRRYAELLPTEPNPHDSLGEVLVKAGKYREAVDEYQRAIQLDSTFVLANEGLGNSLLLSGDFEGARAAYQRLADGAPAAYDRLNGLGWLAASFAHEGHVDETVRHLEKAETAAIAAKDAVWTLQFPVRRALALTELGRHAEAIALADKTLAAIDKSSLAPALKQELGARALVAKGAAQARNSAVDAAKKTFDALVARTTVKDTKLDPRFGAMQTALESILARNAKPDATLTARDGLDQDPWALAVYADALDFQGKAEDAAKARDRALHVNVVTPELGYVRPRLMAGDKLAKGSKFGPVPVTTNSTAALALFTDARRLGEAYKRALALPALKDAIDRDPQFALARAYVYVFSESPEEGKEQLDEAVKLAAAGQISDGERLFVEAFAAEAKGDLAGKEAKLKELSALYAGDWRPAAYLGEHYVRMHLLDQAIASLREAVRRAPNQPYPYNALGYALAFQGKYDDAIAALKKYVDLSPGESNPHDSLAEIDLLAGKPKDAETEYRKSLELSPQFAASYAGLGHARLLAGDFSGAREAYRTMQETSSLNMDRVTAQTWASLTFANEGRFDEAAAAFARAESEADAAKDRLGAALLAARRAPMWAESGRAEDAITLANATLKKAEKLTQAGLAMVQREALFGRGWAEIAAKKLPAAEATARELAALATKNAHPETKSLAQALAAAVDLAESKPADATKALAGGDARNPLVQELIAEALEQTGEGEKAKAARAIVLKPTANHALLALAEKRANAKAAPKK